MSIVVGIKYNNVVYMGCDSQTTQANLRIFIKHETSHKIFKIHDNILIGAVGEVFDSDYLINNPQIFDALIDNKLSKRIIVTEIIPKIAAAFKNHNKNLTDENMKMAINSSFLLAQENKLFFIDTDLTTFEVDDYTAIGSGAYATIAILKRPTNNPVDKCLEALKESAYRDEYVSGPFIVIDTLNLKFERFEVR